MRLKKILTGFICCFIVVSLTLVLATNFLYKIGIARSEHSFQANITVISSNNNQEKATETSVPSRGGNSNPGWYYTVKPELLTIESYDNLKLNAQYIESETKTNTTVILAHGYSGSSYSMIPYAEFFCRELGYNVLMPDARGHGASEGNYIGFGWHDREDYLRWIDKIIDKSGKREKIILFGVSMGGATVLMTSGEELPKNVKAIIDDCGYTSVKDQLTFQLKEMYKLPAFPMIPLTSVMTKIRAGYSFSEASALRQVRHSKTPILYIHGDSDTFVPTDMVYELYEATSSSKDLLVIEEAEHGLAFATNKEAYKNKVEEFLNKYL